MTPETQAERLALYDELRYERFGPFRRLRREGGCRPRSADDDPHAQLARLRKLMEATDGEA
jgi:hypothetical protein